jgi:hypothetical protein
MVQRKALQKSKLYIIADSILFGQVLAFGKLQYTLGLWQAWKALWFYLVL